MCCQNVWVTANCLATHTIEANKRGASGKWVQTSYLGSKLLVLPKFVMTLFRK